MEVPKIFESRYRFCLILWEHEPINSTHLVELCKDSWAGRRPPPTPSTGRLSERGVVKNENAVVTALVSKEQAPGVPAGRNGGGNLSRLHARLYRRLLPEQEAHPGRGGTAESTH